MWREEQKELMEITDSIEPFLKKYPPEWNETDWDVWNYATYDYKMSYENGTHPMTDMLGNTYTNALRKFLLNGRFFVGFPFYFAFYFYFWE